MALETFPFDAADYITSPEAAAAFLADAMDSGDARVVADAIDILERASGRQPSEHQRGETDRRKSSTADPKRLSFEAVVSLLDGLGVKLTPVATPAS